MNTETAPKEAVRKARKYCVAQKARDDRLLRCLRILEAAADEGKECPTNAYLADMLGYAAPNMASGVVSLLETMGFIKVQRGRRNRVVTIVKTGSRTAGTVTSRKPGDWTEDQDAILMDGLAEGVGFTEIGRIVHKSKHACISRFNKLAAEMGEQAI
ncbi:hypothetical protein [Sphingobium baderi]|uniref:Uncharacterized protein n=1 Tax=Sphingobium baderi LL03 TaxID=1114964 RepID=T0HH33_9SPHN|nr:hypothetical protein [Sphingobium baderi]EQA96833.1 hypothetical protein L485_22385 [Sphingobium baderi LL03]KMS64146.1 hypothetical protein V475_20410 [Sphingobium baderi LL03]